MKKANNKDNFLTTYLLEEIKKNTNISCDKIEIPDFDEATFGVLDDIYKLLRKSCFIRPANISCSKGEDDVTDKFKYLGKRLIKKLITFYANPIIEEQNKFNANNVEMLYLIKTYIDISSQKIKTLEEEIEFLKKSKLD